MDSTIPGSLHKGWQIVFFSSVINIDTKRTTYTFKARNTLILSLCNDVFMFCYLTALIMSLER